MIVPYPLKRPLANGTLLLALLASFPLVGSADPSQGSPLEGFPAGDGNSLRGITQASPKPMAVQGQETRSTVTAAVPASHPQATDTALNPAAETLAWVGDTSITTQELFIFSRNNPQTTRLLGTVVGRSEVLRQMIENRLINLTAVDRAGLAPGYDLDALRSAVKKLEREALQADPVTDAEVADYYQQHQASFGIPAAVWIREVFFPLPPDADAKTKEETRAVAEDLRAKLLAGANFAGLAVGLAHTPALRLVAGDQGFLPLHDFPYLEKTTAGMKEGDISPVVTLPDGLQVFQLLGRRDGILSPLEAVAGPIRDHLLNASAIRKRATLIQSAAERYEVRIQDPELQAAWPSTPTRAGQP